ncbi:hypothetical protein PG985_016007 [Apiospora marii]|uniref:uncharacterized protein n=1 Tax=Apiospora marii TaxID=335849 RepID=UPI0031319B98
MSQLLPGFYGPQKEGLGHSLADEQSVAAASNLLALSHAEKRMRIVFARGPVLIRVVSQYPSGALRNMKG